MKIVFVHQYFVDPSHPAGTRPYDLVWALSQRGHEVVVITGNVHLQTRRRISVRPTGGSARVIALPLFSHFGRSLVLRLLNNLDFLIRAVRAAGREADVDLYYGSAMPIFAPIAAAIAARGRGRFVFEVRDLFPESLESVPGLLSWFGQRLFRPIVRRLYRLALCVVVVSPAFVPYVRRYGVAEDRILVVPHGADVELFPGGGEPDPDLHVVYAGALGRAQGVDAFAAIARCLPPDVRVVVYGDGTEAPRVRAAAVLIPNLVWAGVLPKNEIPGAIGAAAICLLQLRDVSIFRTVYPNKLFEYMASGRPTIITFTGVAADLLTTRGAGVLALTPEAVAEQVLRLRRDDGLRRAMGERARRAATNEFDRATLMSGLVRDLEARVSS